MVSIWVPASTFRLGIPPRQSVIYKPNQSSPPQVGFAHCNRRQMRMAAVLFSFCSYEKHHNQKQLKGGKVSVHLTLWVTIHYWGASGQELTAGTQVRDCEGTPLAGFLLGSSLDFFYAAQDHLRNGATHIGWALLCQLIIKINYSQTCPHTHLIWVVIKWGLSSQITLRAVLSNS